MTKLEDGALVNPVVLKEASRKAKFLRNDDPTDAMAASAPDLDLCGKLGLAMMKRRSKATDRQVFSGVAAEYFRANDITDKEVQEDMKLNSEKYSAQGPPQYRTSQAVNPSWSVPDGKQVSDDDLRRIARARLLMTDNAHSEEALGADEFTGVGGRATDKIVELRQARISSRASAERWAADEQVTNIFAEWERGP